MVDALDRRVTGLLEHEDRTYLVAAGAEVFCDVLELMRSIEPLQESWLSLGPGSLVAAAAMLARVTGSGLFRARFKARLRERWPELVPGYAALDRMTEWMVGAFCRADARARLRQRRQENA
jgi:hypothetical protein